MNRPVRCSPQLVAAVIGLTLVPLMAAGTLADLGITDGRAREAIFDAFTTGYPVMVGKADVFKGASADTRVLFVKAAATLARAYVESPAFAARYADHREANQPDPLPPAKTADQVLAKQREDFGQQVEGIRAQFGDITQAQRDTLEQGFLEMYERFDKMETDGRKAEIVEALKTTRAQEEAAHVEATREFDKLVPKDPNVIVAARLRAFLDLTKDINFAARLVERDKQIHFADETFEARPAPWKLCFRAGKEATGAARAFAQHWLQALEAKGLK